MSAALPVVAREALQQKYNLNVKNFTPVSGGCINNGGKLTTDQGVFFIKWNSASKYPRMFSTEARGLKLLTSAGCLRVPGVRFDGEAGEYQFIVMDFVESRGASTTFWEELGRGLAALHQVTSPMFGLDHDNYIGSLPQLNKQNRNWIDFFIHQRLEPQLVMLNASPALRKKFETLYKKLSGVFPSEPPALLHGDLWSGNLIKDKDGRPCLIDPAAYYGYREMDLAFSRLFGGFEKQFYDTYKEVFPLQPGYRERVNLCNLYPLLVHANLFGGHYLTQIEEILAQWS